MKMAAVLIAAVYFSTVSAHTVLEVVSPPKFKPQPTWPQSAYYDEYGPPISLSCDLVQIDGTTLLWFKNDSQLRSSSQLVINHANQTLTLVNPTQNQTGSYKCFAYNSAGNASYTGYIYISARRQDTRPRVVLTEPGNQIKHARIGDNVTISCTFDVGGSTTGLLDFNMDWNKENRSVNDTEHTTWGVNETQSNNQVLSLTIHSFKASDYGAYACIGVNHKGNDSRVMTINPPEQLKRKFPKMLTVVIVSSCTVVLLVLVLTSVLVRRYRRFKKYQRLEWGTPDTENFEVPKYDLKYDVFVSYSHEDLDWVKDNLFKTLLDRNYNVCLDFKDFVPGVATSANIIDAVYKSRKTIVVMSRQFLKSTWGQFELQQAHYRAIAQRKDVLILVKLDDCKVPTKLLGKTFLDWSDTKVRPHFWDRMYEALGKQLKSDEDLIEADHTTKDDVNTANDRHNLNVIDEQPTDPAVELNSDEELLADHTTEDDSDETNHKHSLNVVDEQLAIDLAQSDESATKTNNAHNLIAIDEQIAADIAHNEESATKPSNTLALNVMDEQITAILVQ